MTTFPAAGRQRMLRVLALAALIMSLVVMHHLAGAGEHEQAASTTHAVEAHHGAGVAAMGEDSGGTPDAPANSSSTHLLHLCLAVLSAAVLLLLARARWCVLPARVPRGIAAVRRRRTSPSDVYGSALLTRLCVMRT